MRNNNQSNEIIKWIVIIGDFVLMNVIVMVFAFLHWRMATWEKGQLEIFTLVSNIALMLSMLKFSTIIHLRVVGAGDILRRMVGMISLQALLTYLLLKVFAYGLPIGWLIFEMGTVFFVLLVLKRLFERWFIKLYRQAGRNTRTVTLVGSDPELIGIYLKLREDVTLGYKVLGYYGENSVEEVAREVERLTKRELGAPIGDLQRLGSLDDFLQGMAHPEELHLGEELYLCVSRKEKDVIRSISKLCDQQVVRFYYVPVSVESIGLNLKREFLDDIEIYTTYENPLQNPVNRFVKRVFDIVMSLVVLFLTAFLYPIIWLIIKTQSPGPIFFKQLRTGMDGKDFYCLKFRSMHVNKDADKVQATKNDPRKYPFGNFMRKANLDELPQFWNVLKGDMSIVGPRPHMLAHTEMYSQLIDKYMVRHFVKPGVTGWAQVTGYRGETKELWQMEGRVKRDIWYMEHWSIWLDIRIIWLTIKTIFIHDKHAY